MRILPNTTFYIEILPELSLAISNSKDAAELKISKLNSREFNAPIRELTDLEIDKCVALAHFIAQLENLEETIIGLKELRV
jgi:hypothetical protein